MRASLPDLLPSLIEAREKILVSLSVELQKVLLQPGREISVTPTQTFVEQLELAEKITDACERSALTDKLQRALSTLASAQVCLEIRIKKH